MPGWYRHWLDVVLGDQDVDHVSSLSLGTGSDRRVRPFFSVSLHTEDDRKTLHFSEPSLRFNGCLAGDQVAQIHGEADVGA